MKTQLNHLILFLYFLNCHFSFSQNYGPKEQKAIDSLNHELRLAKYDTAKIRLRFYIGHKTWTMRVSYWDSLAADAGRNGLPLYESRALTKKGFVLRLQHNGIDAIESFKKSLALAEKTGDKSALLQPLCNLATSYFHTLNDIKGAMDLCFRGLKIAEELHDKKNMAALNHLLGQIYLASVEPKKALVYELNCLRVQEDLKARGGIAQTLIMLGKIYFVLGDSANAISCNLKSRQYISEFGESILTADICSAVGAAYEMKHQADSATVYYLRSYAIGQHLDGKEYMVNSLALLAGNSVTKGDFKAAETYASKGLVIAKAFDYKQHIPGLAAVLKKVYLKDKKYREALEAYELMESVTDSISSEKIRKAAMEKQFAYEFEKKKNENTRLAQQNQIQHLQLNQFKLLLFSLGGLLILILTVAVLLIRQNRLKAGQQRILLEQKLLRTQMNPHFIFNSLLAIQNYILRHNSREAVEYLGSFSLVMRNVLESSRTENIVLKKEIELLENYLQLQKLRFGNRFEYEITVDDRIDPEELTIPPMLSQPFIENAIEHGMHNVETGGRIDISFNLRHHCLVMEICDNGYGFSAVDDPGQHQSLAIEITKERIALMNRRKKRKSSFAISVANPLHPDRKGVLVTFSLPLDDHH